ncbi:TolC family protein [Puniceicoccaceae bacterium K14]|nr:TolC family protein [Puniceicoccaceae bacterium K14]
MKNYLLVAKLLLSVVCWSQAKASVEIPDRLDLASSIQYALENNFQIQKARQQIEEQTGLIIEVRAQALPTASLDAYYTEIDPGLSELSPAHDNDWEIALNVTQSLYKGGSVRAALDVQQLVEESALLQLESVVNDALLDVRTGYYDVLLARDQIEVQEQNVGLLEAQVRDAKNRFEAGSVSNFEVLRAEVELANAQTPLIRARNTFRTAIEELRQTLGFKASDHQLEKVPDFVGDLGFNKVVYELESALSVARESRPELKRLEKLLEAREKGIDVARAGFRPTVSLYGSYEAGRSSSSRRFDDRLDGWTVGVQSSWNIFDGRKVKGQVVQAKSQYEQARLDFEEAVLDVEVEVRRALSNLQEAAELAISSGKVTSRAEESLRLAQSRYDAGGATQLDVLQARVSLTLARTNQLEAYHSYEVAAAAARRAMGVADPFAK